MGAVERNGYELIPHPAYLPDLACEFCAPLEVCLFLFFNQIDFMLSFSDDNQSEVIETFNSTSRYLGDLLNIDNFFDSMVNHIYPSELHLIRPTSQIPRPYFWIYTI